MGIIPGDIVLVVNKFIMLVCVMSCNVVCVYVCSVCVCVGGGGGGG